MGMIMRILFSLKVKGGKVQADGVGQVVDVAGV
jgi:hypothetical protein